MIGEDLGLLGLGVSSHISKRGWWREREGSQWELSHYGMDVHERRMNIERNDRKGEPTFTHPSALTLTNTNPSGILIYFLKKKE